MAELTTTAAATAVTGATSAIAAGRPPQEVIVWALMGSMVAVWLDRQKGEPLTVGWAARALGLIFVSLLSGIAGSAGAVALADVPFVGFIAKVERWVLAFAFAALIHKLGPLGYRVAAGRAKKEEAGNVASP
jgi:hypothetical protein